MAGGGARRHPAPAPVSASAVDGRGRRACTCWYARPTIRSTISLAGVVGEGFGLGDAAPVAQHGDRVGDREDLLQLVADQHGGVTPRRTAGARCRRAGRPRRWSATRSARRAAAPSSPPTAPWRSPPVAVWATDSRDTGRSGSRSRSSRSRQRRASARSAARSSRPARRGRCCRKMFSATENAGIRLRSWCTTPMPARWASCGLPSCTVRSSPSGPGSRNGPPSGRYTPVRILIRVLLPAPFSPSSACTLPAVRVSVASSRARTPGNVLTSFSADSTTVIVDLRRACRGTDRAAPRRGRPRR